MRDRGSIHTKLGDTFYIREAANPTTGHSWSPIFDKEWLEFKGQTYEHGQGKVGRGGTQIFTFVSKQRGKHKIQLAYKRPWDTSPLKIETYQVIVE